MGRFKVICITTLIFVSVDGNSSVVSESWKCNPRYNYQWACDYGLNDICYFTLVSTSQMFLSTWCLIRAIFSKGLGPKFCFFPYFELIKSFYFYQLFFLFSPKSLIYHKKTTLPLSLTCAFTALTTAGN